MKIRKTSTMGIQVMDDQEDPSIEVNENGIYLMDDSSTIRIKDYELDELISALIEVREYLRVRNNGND